MAHPLAFKGEREPRKTVLEALSGGHAWLPTPPLRPDR
jgi:hypothetical protein